MQTQQPGRALLVRLSPFILWALVFALYWPTRQFEFLNFDDNQYITENIHVRTGLTWTNLRWAFTSEHGAHWHPLAWISHMIDFEIFGLNPGAYHLVNAALHAANTALLFIFLYLATASFGASLFAAALFGLHPLRIESVAWITERKDVLSVLFLLLTLIGFSKFIGTRSLRFYLFSLFCFSLSLLAKPTAIVLPALLLCLDFWPYKRLLKFSDLRKLLIEKLPFAIVASLVAFAAIWAQSSGGGLKSLDSYPFADRIASALVGYISYFGKLFIPSGLGIFYPFEQYQPGVAAGAAVAIVFISLYLWEKGKVYPWLHFGWAWFLLALLPMIGIVQIGGQAFADRWTYVPHIGLIVAVSWTAAEILKKWPKFQITAGITCVCLFAAMTHTHLPNWKSSESIFRHTIAVSPNNFMAHMNLGVALDAAGNLPEASKHFDIAVTLKPLYPDALNNLGGARARLGDTVSAEHFFRRALSQAPNFVPARYNLGLVLSQTGRPSQALVQWTDVLIRQPAYGQLVQSLSSLLTHHKNQGCTPFLTTGPEIRAIAELKVALEHVSDSALKQKLSSVSNCAQ